MSNHPGFRRAASVAACCLWLAACGGGGPDSGSSPFGSSGNVSSNPSTGSQQPLLDIAGLWISAPDPASTTLMLTLGDVAYGYRIDGSTIHFFQATGYSSTDSGFAFAAGHYEEALEFVAMATASANGRFTGKLDDTSTPQRLSLAFVAPAGVTSTFLPVTMEAIDPATAAAPDARNFTGTYATRSGTMILSATSASIATLAVSNLYGCVANGIMSAPRNDRNVWVVTLHESNCAEVRRNGSTLTGLGALLADATSSNVFLMGEDGQAWVALSGSQEGRVSARGASGE